jgi:hypothetical protein
VRVVGRFFRFWYDFIVGDDWRVAVGVVVSMALGAVLVAARTPHALIAVLVWAGIVVALLLSLRAQLRTRNERG